ncbi:hypothetical protein AB0J05_46065 [Streptomyces phaeochromogenes]
MLRVHFTADDIAHVRVAAAPDPLWEIVNSFQALIREENALAFGEWRRIVRPRLGPADGLLAALLPPRGYFPDFLTPDLGGSLGLESAVDTVLGTPRADLRGDLTTLAASPARPRPLPAEARALAEGTLDALQRLGAALQGYHRRALAAFWPHIRAQVDADRAVRARAVLGGGTDGLLASLRPVLHWQPRYWRPTIRSTTNCASVDGGYCCNRPSSAPDDPSLSPCHSPTARRYWSTRSSTRSTGPFCPAPQAGDRDRARDWGRCSAVPGPPSSRTS